MLHRREVGARTQSGTGGWAEKGNSEVLVDVSGAWCRVLGRDVASGLGESWISVQG